MTEMCHVRILDLIPIFCRNDCVWSNLNFRLFLLFLLLLPCTMLDDSILISCRWRWSENTGEVKDFLYPSAVPTLRTRLRQWFILVLSRFRRMNHAMTVLRVLNLSSLSPDFLSLRCLYIQCLICVDIEIFVCQQCGVVGLRRGWRHEQNALTPAWRHWGCCSMQSSTCSHSSYRELGKTHKYKVGIGFGSHGRLLFGSCPLMQWLWTFVSLLTYQLLPNTDSAPPLLSGHKSLLTEISYCTEFLSISALGLLPQTAVIKHWRHIKIRLHIL
jgi:hypothetical protein